ncbi:sugar ABC transporter substrate-binding protein [Marivibrio halodurans]|uniref:Sugar ABC transporter substrate-binding protein n=1 Tax=Marivibrio halodurans TaxID=2039722 RepID=A0A8J7V1L2_9PROT|nr:sugar ABC transporter substrate-binding protein [Marivibrio halodurans]MBP5856226.1 sugar ABC transporter substrate-binding protein [Marivibrio halodurans]
MRILKSAAVAATLAIGAATGLAGASAPGNAQGIDDPTRAPFYQAMEGKTVVFVPVAMGLDLTEGWAAGMRETLEPFGITVEIRDPNWSTDAGAQAITSLLSEKPDAIVVHNPDVQSYARLLRKAEQAGIYVVQVNMNSSYSTDAFVGADYVSMGERMARKLIDRCGPANGGNGKIAIVQGVLTAAASAYQMKGINNVLEANPDMRVVSNQAADWDATKAKNIAATVLQQHPDLCGIVGFWDVMDIGTGAAIKEAGKDVYLITSGGGNQSACDGLEKGTYSEVVSYDVPGQARDISMTVMRLFQNQPEPGAAKTTLFSPLTFLTKENMTPGSCWTLDR